MTTPPPKAPLLGVNIDHVATLRQARGVDYPNPIKAALICEQAGADGITLHLREDRRHIQDSDVYRMRPVLKTRMNLEMAMTDEMLKIACEVKPAWVCLVPEKREELTTEGGLNVAAQQDALAQFIRSLHKVGTRVSLFIDPEIKQIDTAIACGADAIELHTGQYAESCLATKSSSQSADNNVYYDEHNKEVDIELQRLTEATVHALNSHPKLLVNAGHGLTRDNVFAIAQISGIHELNIGHALIADSIFMGLDNAVKAMKQAMVMPNND